MEEEGKGCFSATPGITAVLCFILRNAGSGEYLLGDAKSS